MKKIDEESIINIGKRIKELSRFYNMTIKLHEARWIYEGSGYIKINNDINIKFYINEDRVKYFTEDRSLLDMFSNLKLDLRIKEIWGLKKESDSIINSYY